EVIARAASLKEALEERGVASEVIEHAGAMGGGSLAEEVLRSASVAIDAIAPGAPVEVLARRLRTGEPAVLGRISEGRLLLDVRTVLPGEEAALIDAVVLAVRGASASGV
ncbi:MAG: hypothetical protein L6Q76_16310, partial [Polyangiaceae bacterium]|nr:hypothetical protein [Polyangiaceae bacterium]